MAVIQQHSGAVPAWPQSAASACTMTPVQINGAAGWLHMPTGATAALGALLCPALGREARWSYRALRQLADRLAAAGLPTLRFNYPGTADSADMPAWEEPLECWRDSVHAAADWLRATTGVDHLMLAGLRFGALLAADVSAMRGDVASLCLMAPVLSGRPYARELQIVAVAGTDDAPPDRTAQDGIELDGMVLPKSALAAIARIDLARSTSSPAPKVLMLDNHPRTAIYADQLRGQGADVIKAAFPGQDELMRVATSNRSPIQAWTIVAAWAAGLAAEAGLLAGPPRPLPPAPVLQVDSWRESPVQFGPDRSLAGILCEPPPGCALGRAVVIPNTGGDPHSGIARFGVVLARTLAERGIASLRFDLAGLGDSRLLPGDEECHLYETQRTNDLRAALDVLAEAGYHQLGGAGLCTGAYHLLKAAEQESRLRLIAAINLVTFQWRPGGTVEVAQRALGRSNTHYMDLARRPGTWLRVLRGGVDVPHVIRTIVQRLSQRAMRRAAPLGVARHLIAPRRSLQRMTAGGTKLLFIFGAEDPGVGALETHFGRGGRDLASLPGVQLRIDQGIDHTLSRRAMQTHIAAAVSAFAEA